MENASTPYETVAALVYVDSILKDMTADLALSSDSEIIRKASEQVFTNKYIV